MEQKEAVQDALKQAADDEEKARLLGDLRSLTSKLYSLSGKAKVGCGRVNGEGEGGTPRAAVAWWFAC